MAEPVTTEELEKLVNQAESVVREELSFRHSEALCSLAREALANRKAGEWRPIAEAPKDGEILVLTKREKVKQAHYYSTPGRTTTGFIDSNRPTIVFIYDATHWMPLPALPLTDAGGSDG